MKLIPDNPNCEICGCPATTELRDTLAQKDHLYCRTHLPELWPGKNPHWTILRYRNEPGSPISKLMAAAESSPEHQSFQTEMCDLQLLGGEGACRYYLSRLTDSDQFALWQDEFLDNVREYVVAETGGAAAYFPIGAETLPSIVPFLRYAFERSRSTVEPKLTTKDRAVILLLQHPTWSDERIAEEVPTTKKQLERNSNYTSLRAAVVRNERRNKKGKMGTMT